ncbi:MAG: carboxypeptidase regulatory-like domain-containing protein [Sphingobacteriaceae bacterium]|nr:carboxypeptidase regulatory-like domain-containing protein [Sphingobacteriaceae bacterium]
MKRFSILISVIFVLISCEKETGCSGKITDKNFNPFPNKNVYLTDSKKSENKTKIVTTSDIDGNYQFTIKTKRSHSYYVTFGTEGYGYFTLEHGKQYRKDIILPQ